VNNDEVSSAAFSVLEEVCQDQSSMKYFIDKSRSGRAEPGRQLPLALLEEKHGANGTAFVTKFLRSREGF